MNKFLKDALRKAFKNNKRLRTKRQKQLENFINETKDNN
jgi:hypothetical protein